MLECTLKHVRLSVLLLTGLQICANAQSTFATLTGTVTDQSGAVLPGVSISGTNRQTGYTYTTKANESGQYTLANLVEGAYSIVATAAGFGEYKVDDVILTPRDVRRIDV